MLPQVRNKIRQIRSNIKMYTITINVTLTERGKLVWTTGLWRAKKYLLIGVKKKTYVVETVHKAFQETVWVKKGILNEPLFEGQWEGTTYGSKFTVHKVKAKSGFTMPGTGYRGLEN